MKRKLILALAGPFALVSMVASAQPIGNPEAGQQKSAACAACHGEDGNSPTPQFPRLAGQHADYLLQALKDYKTGGRQNPVMQGQVANLTEEDMEDLAAYFASQEGTLRSVRD